MGSVGVVFVAAINEVQTFTHSSQMDSSGPAGMMMPSMSATPRPQKLQWSADG
jgi:hypothetical protein